MALPGWEVLTGPRWGRQPWNDFSLVCFGGCLMCPHTPGPVGKWSWGSYFCKVVPHRYWPKEKEKEKESGDPNLCITLASEGLGSLSWAKSEGTSILQASNQERSPNFFYIFRESPMPCAFHTPAHQDEATGGGNSFTFQIFIKYIARYQE